MTTPLLRSARRAQCWLNSRNDSPIRVPPAQSVTVSATRSSARSRSRSRRSRVTRVSRVPNTNDSVRTADAGQRLAEPEQEPGVALHRARDVADDHERARPADRAPPDPLEDVAAGRQAAPEHRPRGDDAAVPVELAAARPAPLEVAAGAGR